MYKHLIVVVVDLVSDEMAPLGTGGVARQNGTDSMHSLFSGH